MPTKAQSAYRTIMDYISPELTPSQRPEVSRLVNNALCQIFGTDTGLKPRPKNGTPQPDPLADAGRTLRAARKSNAGR
jgi:hypothetical protein